MYEAHTYKHVGASKVALNLISMLYRRSTGTPEMTQLPRLDNFVLPQREVIAVPGWPERCRSP